MNITRFQPGTILGALLLLGLSACSGHHQDDSDGSVTPPASAPTVTIAASPSTITQGGSTTLTWSTTDATACTASGGWSGSKATSGSESATPAASGSVTYTLTCTGTGGSAVNSTTVTVTAAPATPAPTVNISAAPTSVTLGSATTLAWSTANATACTASGNWTGSRGVSGTESSTPAATGSANYTLTCTGTGGSASGTATVTVSAASPAPVAPTVTLNANPSTVTVGASTTLTWSSTDATGCTASDAWTGSRGTSGTESATPAAAGTSNYTLTCTGPGGSAASTASVTVNPPPTAKLTIKGRVIDAPIPNAPVIVTVGTQTFTGNADGDGNYAIPVEILAGDAVGFVSITADAGAGSPVHFLSLLGSYSTLVSQAGIDGTLVSTENFRTNVTNFSTAEAALVMEANNGKMPASDDELMKALVATDFQLVTDIATAIKLVVDDGVALPAGASDTLQLASSPAIRAPFIADQMANNADQYMSEQTAALNDPALTMGSTPATVPAVVFADQTTQTPSDDFYGDNGGGGPRFVFNRDGSGTFANSVANSTGLLWTVDGSGNIVVTFSSDPTYQYKTRTLDPSDAKFKTSQCTDDLQSVTLRQTNPMSATAHEQHSVSCDNGSSFQRQSSYSALFATPAQLATLGSISTADFSGKTATLKLYDHENFNNVASFETPADFVTFNADGTGSTRFFGLGLTWNITDGALNVSYSNGLTARYTYLRGLIDNETLLLSEFTAPSGTYVTNSLVAITDGTFTFTNANTVGDYYQYGVGASSLDTEEASDNSDTGATGDPLILKGFGLRFTADGFNNSLNETFEEDANGNVDRATFLGGRRYWGVRADGSVTVQAPTTRSGASNACSPGFDSTDPNCALTDVRDVFPVSVRGNRRIVLERRRLSNIDPSNYVTSTTPADFLVRFYDVAPVGDYEMPRSDSATAKSSPSVRRAAKAVRSTKGFKEGRDPQVAKAGTKITDGARKSLQGPRSMTH